MDVPSRAACSQPARCSNPDSIHSRAKNVRSQCQLAFAPFQRILALAQAKESQFTTEEAAGLLCLHVQQDTLLDALNSNIAANHLVHAASQAQVLLKPIKGKAQIA